MKSKFVMKTTTKICKCCGTEFEAQSTSQSFCSTRCKHFFTETEKRWKEHLAISEHVKESTRQLIQSKPYLSISDAAKFLGVSRNTLYKIIRTGGIRTLRFSARTVRVSTEDLKKYVPIDLSGETNDDETTARLEKLAASRPKKRRSNKTATSNESKAKDKGHITPSIAVSPKTVEKITPAAIEEPSVTDPDGWYSYAQLVRQLGITSEAIKQYCRWNSIPRKQIGLQTFISKPHWDRARGNNIDMSKYYSTKELVNKYKLEKHYMLTILLKKDVTKIKIGNFAYFDREEADRALSYRLEGTRANAL